MLQNASYLPSTNFVLATNPGNGMNIAIAPEIETEENIAYECPIHDHGSCDSELTNTVDELETDIQLHGVDH